MILLKRFTRQTSFNAGLMNKNAHSKRVREIRAKFERDFTRIRSRGDALRAKYFRFEVL